MRNSERDLVYVEWLDHMATGAEWLEPEDYKLGKIPLACSVGWLLEENKDELLLMASTLMSDSEYVGNLQRILKRVVTKRVVVRKGEKNAA